MAAPGAQLLERASEAGFTPEEVHNYEVRRRRQMLDAGFSEAEVGDYFGRPEFDQPSFSQEVRQHLESVIPVEERENLTLMRAIELGLQMSVSGLTLRSQLPEAVVGEEAPLALRIASQAATLAGDFPAMVGGAAITSPAGPLIAMGGAFALSQALRRMYLDRFSKGEVTSLADFWERLSAALLDEGKGFVTGVATGGAGRIAAPLGTAGQVGAEVLTLAKVGAALEGHEAKPDHFAEAALLIGGLRGAVRGGRATSEILQLDQFRKLRQLYIERGVKPEQVVEDLKVDPTIVEDLNSTNIRMPRAYSEPPRAQALGEPKAPLAERLPEAKAVGEEPLGPALTALDKVLSKVSVGEGSPKRSYSLEQFYTNWVDRLHPLNKALQAMADGKPVEIVEDFYRKARMLVGSTGKATHFLEFSPFRYGTYERVGESLKSILEPVAKGKIAVEGKEFTRFEAFRGYLVAKRVTELDPRDIRTPVELEAAKSTVRQLEAEFEPLREKIFEYQSHVLDYLRDSGVLSAESVEMIRAANQFYVPFFRVLESAKARGRGKSAQVFNPLRRIKGEEELLLVDPLESIIKNTYAFITLAERNAVRRSFVEMVEKSERGEEFATKKAAETRPIQISKSELRRMLKRMGDEEAAERLNALFDQELGVVFRATRGTPKANEVDLFRNGQRETWETTPEIARALGAMDRETANILFSILRVPARLLRAGAILSPEFVARNPLRDTFMAYLNSDSGFRLFSDSVIGAFQVANKTEWFQDWVRSGGAHAELVAMDRRYLQTNLRTLARQTGLLDSARNVVKSPIEMLRIASQLMEQATRVGEFRRARLRGKGIEEAGFESREISLDFGRIGANVTALNAISAFFNAQVQGVDKMIRVHKEHPGRTALRGIAGITIPSILLHLANRDDPMVKRAAQWEKDLFWLIPADLPVLLEEALPKLGIAKTERVLLRIPKPFEPGLVYGTMAERAVDFILDQDPRAFETFLKRMAQSLTPGLPTASIPIIEQFANRSIFTDRPLIPQSRENLLPEYQYKTYTTETAKMLGRLLAKIPGVGRTRLASPPIIENYVRAWTGGLGVHILHALDAALRGAGVLRSPVKPRDTLADLPFVKAFIVRHPSFTMQPVTDFYDRYQEIDSVFETMRTLAKEGNIVEAQRLLERAGQQGMIRLRTMRESLSKISAAARMVDQNPEMSRDEKRQIIDELSLQMVEIAEIGNLLMDEIEEMQP